MNRLSESTSSLPPPPPPPPPRRVPPEGSFSGESSDPTDRPLLPLPPLLPPNRKWRNPSRHVLPPHADSPSVDDPPTTIRPGLRATTMLKTPVPPAPDSSSP